MPEVAAGAAVLVDPTDPAAIARGIGEARRRRATLTASGLVRHRSRGWADVAGDTIGVYHWVARKPRVPQGPVQGGPLPSSVGR